MAEARCDGRSARYLYFDSNRRCADGNLFRKEIPLPTVSLSAVPPANKNLRGDAEDRCAGRCRVFADVCLHHGRLRDHSRLWTSGPGRFRRRRAGDASALLTSSRAELCCFACCRAELRRTPRGPSPAVCLFGDRDCVADDAAADVDYISRTGDADSYFLTRPASDRLWERVPADRLIELRLGWNCFYNFERLSGNR